MVCLFKTFSPNMMAKLTHGKHILPVLQVLVIYMTSFSYIVLVRGASDFDLSIWGRELWRPSPPRPMVRGPLAPSNL